MSLLRFLIRRILSGIVVLWLVATLAFFLFFARNPGAIVARALGGRAATSAVLGSEITRRLGLNQPILTQYWHFLGTRTIHFNLGVSYFSGGEPVSTIQCRRTIPRPRRRCWSKAGWCCG